MGGFVENRTTIQISDDIRKELKILAFRRDISYQELLKDMIDVFKELDRDKTIISIPTPLAEKMKNKEGFGLVSEFATFVLRQILVENGEKEIITKNDEEKIKRKLRTLGYLG